MSCSAWIDATTSTPEHSEFLRSNVCGEALFLHAAHAAASAQSVSETIIVTTDPEIELLTRKSGFEARLVGGNEPAKSLVDRVAHFGALTSEIVAVVSARAPLVTSDDIDSFVRHAAQGTKDGVFSAFQSDPTVDTGTLYAFSHPAAVKAGSLAKMQLNPEFLPAFHVVQVRRSEDLQSVAALLKRQPLQHVLKQHELQALILDFDGVFTDNKVIVSADGHESAICDRSDGFAIQSLQRRGFPILVLSTEKVPIVRARSEKLGLECIHGVGDKRSILTAWLRERNIDPRQTVYVGNDLNDLECMAMVGVPIAVADAFPEVLSAARCILRARGGHGAVREIAMAMAAVLDEQA